MFTLGNKEAIVNSVNKFKITDKAGNAFTAADNEINIEGFGMFNIDQIVSANGSRYNAGHPGAIRIEVPTAAAIGLTSADDVNVATVFHVRVIANSDSSEWANDFIKRGRPFIFELMLNFGETADQVADKILAVLANYDNIVFNEGLPFTYSKSTVGTNVGVTLVGKATEIAFNSNVEFLRRQESYGLRPEVKFITENAATGATALAAATTIPVADSTDFKVGDVINIYDLSAQAFLPEDAKVTSLASATTLTVETGFAAALAIDDIVFIQRPGEDPINSGKYLEENVRMGTYLNAHPYGTSPGEVPIIGGAYTSISWVSKATDNDGVAKTWQPHANLSIVAAGAETGTRNQTFTLYFNEDSTLLSSGGVVEEFVDWLLTSGSVNTTNFYLENRGAPADGAAFVA